MKKINFEEAFEIAKEYESKIDWCKEFKDGFRFGFDIKEDEEYDGEIGPVILKETGKAISWVDFILDYHPERKPIKVYEGLNYETK